MKMCCPQCAELVWDAPYDEEKMFSAIIIHAWRVHDVRTKEELYALTGMKE